ncbi:MAG: hypothetical protein ABI589_12895 [Burkholderiales bacterium]
MRTTLALDDDAFLAAREVAQRERISMGKAVSKLVRQGAGGSGQAGNMAALKGKYSIYPRREGALVTSEDVYRLMEQEGI